MVNHDYANLSRKALLAQLEIERQQWLAAGMDEADIFRIHFGDEDENGRGGDYGVWLSERKFIRTDHKYCPGAPLSIDAADPDGAWISGGRGELDNVEFGIDFDSALSKLTEAQRFCFIEVALNGRTQQSVADDLKVTQQMVDKHLRAAGKKLKIFFSGRL